MKINSINLNYDYTTFTSRRSDVKKADDIQRRAKTVFPMMSNTYIADMYKSYNSDSRSTKRRARKICKHIERDVRKGRHLLSEYTFSTRMLEGAKPETPYAPDLNYALRIKKGNCSENAYAAMAALCANGYYNSDRLVLYNELSFVNKKTNEVEYCTDICLDHIFAVTDMNKGGEKDVVVDPWLGFADTIEGAMGRFKQLYDEDDYKKYIDIEKKKFKAKVLLEKRKFNPDDYELKTRMILKPPRVEPPTKEQLIDLGNYARVRYEGILLDKEA